jgi:hypothetical protein
MTVQQKKEKSMSTKILLTCFVALGLLLSGCQGVSYAAAPDNTATAAPVEPTTEPVPTEMAFPAVQNPVEAEALSITLDDLVEIWFNGSYITFKSNGVYAIYGSLDTLQAGEVLDEGQYGVQGDQLWLGPQSRHCNGMGFYQLTSKGENELEFTQIREECSRYIGKIEKYIP